MKNPKLNNLKWWGIDFDQTICRSKYNPITDKWDMLGIMPDTKEALTKIQNSGKKVIVYSSRSWAEYVEIEEFMNDNKLPFNKIVCGKLLLEVLIDDRAIHFDGWREIIAEQLWKD